MTIPPRTLIGIFIVALGAWFLGVTVSPWCPLFIMLAFGLGVIVGVSLCEKAKP